MAARLEGSSGSSAPFQATCPHSFRVFFTIVVFHALGASTFSSRDRANKFASHTSHTVVPPFFLSVFIPSEHSRLRRVHLQLHIGLIKLQPIVIGLPHLERLCLAPTHFDTPKKASCLCSGMTRRLLA